MRHIFDDIRVLDFSRVLAAPTISRFFAEMGADVIKVELPPSGVHGLPESPCRCDEPDVGTRHRPQAGSMLVFSRKTFAGS